MFGMGALPLDPTMDPLWPRQPRRGKKCELLLYLYGFPTAAMAKDHKLSAYKQGRFITLWFWRSKEQRESHGLKSRCWQGCDPLRGPKEVSTPFLSQLLEAAYAREPVAQSSIPRPSSVTAFLDRSLTLTFFLSPPHFRDPCDSLGLTRIIHTVFSIPRSDN